MLVGGSLGGGRWGAGKCSYVGTTPGSSRPTRTTALRNSSRRRLRRSPGPLCHSDAGRDDTSIPQFERGDTDKTKLWVHQSGCGCHRSVNLLGYALRENLSVTERRSRGSDEFDMRDAAGHQPSCDGEN